MLIRTSIFLLVMAAQLSSCVAYEADPTDPARVADELNQRAGQALSLTAALQLAFRQNPDLAALGARVRAAEATTVPIDALGELRGRSEAVGVMIDPIALLGLGPRGARIDSIDAQQAATVANLAVGRWRVAAELLAGYGIAAGLDECTVEDFDVDAGAFERAGLASKVAAAQLRAAQAGIAAERIALARDRSDNLARMRRALGLPRTASLQLLATEFTPPAASDRRLLRRPDLGLAAARFEVADAEFREAVADQYPSIQLGPNVSLRGDPLKAMGMFRIPFGMAGRAAAARERRTAARHEIESAFLRAQQEASLATARVQSATANLQAARTALAASTTAWRAAQTSLETEPDAFTPYARAARNWVRDTRAFRMAVTEHARARADYARAYGWPNPEGNR